MKAIRVHSPGGPEALRYEDMPQPSPAAGQVLVKVEAAGVNYIDVYQRTGLYKVATPFTLGQEAAGVVRAVGPGVTDPKPGDRVAYTSILGAYAEYAVVPADRVVVLPDGVTTRQASTCWYTLSTSVPSRSNRNAGPRFPRPPTGSPPSQGISKSLPVVLRASSARCASATSARENSCSMRSLSAPLLIHDSTSPARATSSARVSM